jgi:hypothetical protein
VLKPDLFSFWNELFWELRPRVSVEVLVHGVTSGALCLDFSKMSFFGLTDLPASHEPDECPHCDGAFHVASGLCLRCLLQAGLSDDDNTGSEIPDALASETE